MTGMSAAHLGSISLATSASTAENTSRMPSLVMWAESSTVIPACSAESGSEQNHLEAPLSSFTASELLARRAARCRQLANLEHRVTGQGRQELLSGQTGRTHYGNRDT